MRKVMIIIAICALAVGVLFMLGPADAKTIVVDDDWAGADYDNIRDAINAAREGDTVRVYDGTYNEDNVVDKAIDLVGNGTSTIIDGYKKDHTFGFNLAHGGCQVSGFYFYKWWPTHHYGAIGVFSDDNVIFDNTFYDNGRGIFFGRCRNNEIFNNTFDDSYYHILAREGIEEVRIAHNSFTKQYSSGILIQHSRGVEIFSNTFFNHTRCAMTVSECSDVAVSFNMFLACDDTSERRIGASLHLSSDVNVDNNTFIGHGRAVFAWGTTDVRIEHNTILDGEEGLYFSRTWVERTQTGPWCNGTIVRNNNIIGQSRLGANATYGQVTSIDARYNWWAAASGPYHNSTNTAGLGVAVTDLITYDPYLSSMVADMPPVAIIHKVTPNITTEGDPVTFMGRGLARNVTTEHVWTSSIDGEIYHGTDVVFTLSDLSPGTHTITLKVRDTYGEWSEEVSTTLVVNGLPTARIKTISPPVVNEGELVVFLGEALDPENDIARVVWKSDIDGVIGYLLEFGTTWLSNGTHTITLAVMDCYGAWSRPATGEVIVNGIPRSGIEPLERPLVNEGEPVILRGLYHDHEDSVVAYWWGSDIDGVLSDQPMFHTSSLTNGTHTITFRVMDDFMVWSENATATVTVNGLPRVTIASITPRPAIEDESVSFEGDWTDHEGRISMHEWVSDIDGTISYQEDFVTVLLSRGTHAITYRVMDGQGVWSEWAWTTVTVNGRPKAWIEPFQEGRVNEGDTVSLEGGFSDPEDDIRGYRWESDLDGVVGTVWDLTISTLTNGTHVISFQVMDGMGAWSAPSTVLVTVNGIPRCRILDIEPVHALEGEVVQLSGAWEDHEDDITRVEWTSSIDGLLGGGPVLKTSSLSNGTHTITLLVMDGHGIWSEPATGTVKVNGRPRSWIESAGPAVTLEGRTVSLSGAATDDLAVVAYLWTSSIDGDLSEMAVFSTGDLSPGEHIVTFTALDNEGVWSEPSTTTLLVEAIVLDLELRVTELPEEAVEGQLLTLRCTVSNRGNVAMGGLTVRFLMNSDEVATVSLDRAISPGKETVLETSWTALVGQHALLVELYQGEAKSASKISDGTVLVMPFEDPEEPNGPPERPSSSDDADTGLDRTVLTALVVAVVISVAVFNVAWLRSRSSR